VPLGAGHVRRTTPREHFSTLKSWGEGEKESPEKSQGGLEFTRSGCDGLLGLGTRPHYVLIEGENEYCRKQDLKFPCSFPSDIAIDRTVSDHQHLVDA